MSNPTITPFLWFDADLKEVMKYYSSIFRHSKTESLSPMSATFELEGQKFMALNGGPLFKFNESVSFFINVETQEEIDYYWNKLTADGGQESRCGWLKDKYGLSWQVIPSILGQLLFNKDSQKAQKAMDAMMKMNKLVIADLKKAAES